MKRETPKTCDLLRHEKLIRLASIDAGGSALPSEPTDPVDAGFTTGVLRQGYYALRVTRPGRRERETAQLKCLMTLALEMSRSTYGSPRMHADLTRTGYGFGDKRVALIMRDGRMSGERMSPTELRGESTRSRKPPIRRSALVNHYKTIFILQWCGE
jgi:hypothetical protein